ncbi:hypothetical protein RhiJN_26371 [Ceratobasidium sp. AG-Ba]|nr:hypothetical protein RhiJN_26371 [Ceratobasidium sp. AG-Ba]
MQSPPESPPFLKTGWVNKPYDFEELKCEEEYFKAPKIIGAVTRAVHLERNGLKDPFPNGHMYPRTLESSHVIDWYDWLKGGNKDTVLCGDKSGEVGLYPISNNKLVGPYRVAISKNYRMVFDKIQNEKIRVYAFCGLAVHGEGRYPGYKMCNNFQKENFVIWDPESEEDLGEEPEMERFVY